MFATVTRKLLREGAGQSESAFCRGLPSEPCEYNQVIIKYVYIYNRIQQATICPEKGFCDASCTFTRPAQEASVPRSPANGCFRMNALRISINHSVLHTQYMIAHVYIYIYHSYLYIIVIFYYIWNYMEVDLKVHVIM